MWAPWATQKDLAIQRIFRVYTIIVIDGQDQKSADSHATSP